MDNPRPDRTTRWCVRVAVATVVSPLSCRAIDAPDDPQIPGSIGIWITPAELAALPMEGEAWEHLLDEAQEPTDNPDLSDQDDNTDAHTLAKALVYARTGDESYRQQVITACMLAIGTEDGGRTLALGRNLVGYVIAADLVGLPPLYDTVFSAWLAQVRYEDLDGRTLISTHEDRPNNWGTHAGASRMAAALYLGDLEDLEAATTVFKGYLGDRDAYAGFDYGELWWQADPDEPVGVNPAGSTIEGHPVGGVLPDDQRRGGPFQWPPPAENYVYEALQGALVQAVILHRRGQDVWNWEDRALLRAYQWLHAHAHYPAEGDDTWQPHIANYYYGTLFPAPVPANHGKNVGFTDWTHATCNGDLDGDGAVDLADVIELLEAWGTDPGGPPDYNRDGSVDSGDLIALLGAWGLCPQ